MWTNISTLLWAADAHDLMLGKNFCVLPERGLTSANQKLPVVHANAASRGCANARADPSGDLCLRNIISAPDPPLPKKHPPVTS